MQRKLQQWKETKRRVMKNKEYQELIKRLKDEEENRFELASEMGVENT